MTDISDAADLIETARDALLRDVLPALPGERRYLALMIANAMAIATREVRLGAAARSRECAGLAALVGAIDEAPSMTGDAAGPGDLPALRRAVRTAVRGGHFDSRERRAALAAELARAARDRVAISNPKALPPESHGPGPESHGPGPATAPGHRKSPR